jgi:translation initiation factor 4A
MSISTTQPKNDNLPQPKYDSFEKMSLKDNILRGIFAYGFEKPSEIQAKAITRLKSGKDIIAQSQSGTGKTGAFVIGALERIDEKKQGCQVIILSPTRELAEQIKDVSKAIGNYTSIKVVLCVGESDIHEARKNLEKGSCMVVGTPGRIIDMIKKRYIYAEDVKLLIMDEADEMLGSTKQRHNSFMEQVKRIVASIPQNAQICLFSATITDEMSEVTKNFMNNPEQILIKKEELTLDGIKQFYINVDQERWKYDTLCDLYDIMSINQSIVYVNTRQRADWLKEQLEKKNFPVSVIHSSMPQSQRTIVMKEFRNAQSRILISTDLLARGIDIQQISIVINYDLPHDRESYIHRIGRSGRFGRKGVAINFVIKKDFWKIRELEKTYTTQITEMPQNIQEYI